MERSDYLAQIKSLSDTVSQFKDMISYLKSAHESDVAEKSRLQAQLLKFEELIVSLTNEVSSLRKELAKQNDRNNRKRPTYHLVSFVLSEYLCGKF